LLREKGVAFEEVDLNQGLSVAQLDSLIGSRDYRDFLNSRNELYRERGMKENPPPRAEALKLMSQNPNLIKRPILAGEKEILLGFDEARWARGPNS
jgi:arsenate reductase (glutaredoxin)